MTQVSKKIIKIPSAPKSIQKGIPVKEVLNQKAVSCLADNISIVYPDFNSRSFVESAIYELEPLGIIERGKKISQSLRQYLPSKYSSAIEILLASLTPPLDRTDDFGLAVFFYFPHSCFIAEYGTSPIGNANIDPFEISMHAQYELTKRFSAEFSIRPFLIQEQQRTLSRLYEWVTDPDPHVRRLCSEGTRPRLPWATRLPSFIKDPSPVLPILEALKDDKELYVRRSVANHLGDIAKNHPELVFELCKRWLDNSSNDVKWVIRHALRHPAKKGNKIALQLRVAAKSLK